MCVYFSIFTGKRLVDCSSDALLCLSILVFQLRMNFYILYFIDIYIYDDSTLGGRELSVSSTPKEYTGSKVFILRIPSRTFSQLAGGSPIKHLVHCLDFRHKHNQNII